jgi:methyl-accepting chemotaxis protein
MQHLTWQAKQVANGDYSQRVDFMGEFSEAFNFMIVSLDNRERQLKKKIDKLESANSYIKNLEGILPICTSCKKVRLEGTDPKNQDNWVHIESYISQKTNAQFTHSICPECLIKLYPYYIVAG